MPTCLYIVICTFEFRIPNLFLSIVSMEFTVYGHTTTAATATTTTTTTTTTITGEGDKAESGM